MPKLPRPLARARTRAIASTRRAGVNVLMRASNVPVVRPIAELGMRTMFDALAPDWERIRRDPTYREGFDSALALLPSGFRPRRALDVACGTGLACRFLLDRWPQLRLDACDISPRMVDAAGELAPSVTFTVASVHHLPYEDGEFDLVTVLDGLLDAAELLRVLHRKGRLLVVYSRGGTTPVSRPLDEVAGEFETAGGVCRPSTEGPAHVLVVRHAR
ncbi:MAG: methyltransferase domain-containing protein [Thermoleophilia bacterium]|nr:methyltransferase domain-containing protein [Thermoleophilia bacterium]